MDSFKTFLEHLVCSNYQGLEKSGRPYTLNEVSAWEGENQVNILTWCMLGLWDHCRGWLSTAG